MMHKRCRRFFFLMPLIVALIAGLLALAVYGLWNNVLTDVLPVKLITYWQALGLLVLARILVGGFPRRGGGGGWGGRGRQMMMQHWESLTPEQREKLRAGIDDRCCWGSRRHGSHGDFPSEEPQKTTGSEPIGPS